MSIYRNPFPNDPDRQEIWTMLVERDIEAFVASDWSLVEGDFLAEGFQGIDGRGSDQPDSWRLTFPDLGSYRDSWLAASRNMTGLADADEIRNSTYAATTLGHIDIEGDAALARKKFDGNIRLRDGSTERLNWQTLYQCRRVGGRWKISGFVGYLPHPMGGAHSGLPVAPDRSAGKTVPEGASQHVTAGPYSPVLRVRADHLVVISGQAAIAADGTLVGDDVRSQAVYTLDNCERQLAQAGCSLADVFKVNVYLTNLAEWGAFNEVYSARIPEPRPVRTAVQTPLLPGLLVEIEMWAVAPS